MKASRSQLNINHCANPSMSNYMSNNNHEEEHKKPINKINCSTKFTMSKRQQNVIPQMT